MNVGELKQKLAQIRDGLEVRVDYFVGAEMRVDSDDILTGSLDHCYVAAGSDAPLCCYLSVTDRTPSNTSPKPKPKPKPKPEPKPAGTDDPWNRLRIQVRPLVPAPCQLDQTGRWLVQCPSCKARGTAMAGDGPAVFDVPALFDFGVALRLMREGKRVRRQGWNGKNQWIALPHQHENAWLRSLQIKAFLLSTEQGVRGIWAPSQTDMLSEDWEVVP